ncbi:hypothetical protein J0910_13705 [Nocardiopsis sp. CNT-189]
MTQTTTEEVTEELVLLATHLLNCARGLFNEPQAYGPIRCLDAARRTFVIAEKAGLRDERLADIRARLDDFMCGPMEYHDLAAFLDELCATLLTALKESDVLSSTGGERG